MKHNQPDLDEIIAMGSEYPVNKVKLREAVLALIRQAELRGRMIEVRKLNKTLKRIPEKYLDDLDNEISELTGSKSKKEGKE